MENIKKICYAFMALVMLTGNASALGISSASFGDVELGHSYNQSVVLTNSPNDFDNHFVIEINGAIKDLIKVSPVEFDLAKGNTKEINLILAVPEEAPLGDITGTITAVGQKTVSNADDYDSGTNVGYGVATKSNIYANIVKSGALASIDIISVEAPATVISDSVAKFNVKAKNTGNVVTSASFTLTVKKDATIVEDTMSSPVNFTLGDEKEIKLFWDTQGLPEGRYEAFIEASTIAQGSEKTSSTTYQPVPISIGEAKETSNVLIVAAGAIILIALMLITIFRRRK
jgi:hypothetical protein